MTPTLDSFLLCHTIQDLLLLLPISQAALVALVTRAGVVAPVAANVSSIETPLLLHPGGGSAIVSLLDFRCSAEFSVPSCADSPSRQTPIPINLTITLPFAPTRVRSTQLGALPFSVMVEETKDGKDGQGAVLMVEVMLTHADMLVLSRPAKTDDRAVAVGTATTIAAK
eukprot:SAG11_NODE_102_length_16709_cov_31.066093_5_plen_169_part_00